MSKTVLRKKLERISALLAELEKILARPFSELEKDNLSLPAAERKFLLIVELASEINTSLILDKIGQTPDSYSASFSQMRHLGIMTEKSLARLVESAKLRNILVHEYDFESDNKKFYDFAKAVIPAYREYLKTILAFLNNRRPRKPRGTG